MLPKGKFYYLKVIYVCFIVFIFGSLWLYCDECWCDAHVDDKL